MRMNRKAVTDLPIKLLIISVILSVSLPIIADSLDSSRSGMDMTQMESESQRIAGAAASVYYSSEGSGRYLDLEIPEGCILVLGGKGEESFAIHMYRGSEEIGKYWMEKPMIPFKETIRLEGCVYVCISADGTGITVTEA